MNTLRISLTLMALAWACSSAEKPLSPPPGFGSPPPHDTGLASNDTGTPPQISDCEKLGLPDVDFNPEGTSIPKRHAPAGDFTVSLVDGPDWTLSDHWTGCESYIFLPHWLPVDEADNRSWWSNGIAELFERSPPNAHYFFVVAGASDAPEEYTAPLMDDIASQIARLDPADAAWWTDRLHVVSQPSANLAGLVQKAFQGNIGQVGFAIDRFQRFRTLGSMAAVDAYDSALGWPWERRIYEAGAQAEYYNFEATRQARLDAEEATVVTVLTGEEYSGFQDAMLALPGDIQDYDTLEIDVVMECPNTNGYEMGNCGAWDYLAHMWLWEDPLPAEERKGSDDTGMDDTGMGDTGMDDTGMDAPPSVPTGEWHEMARFITTYHRESRWVVDASHALAWLQEGGERTVRYEWAPSWNPQPTLITTRFRFSKRGKDGRPVELVHLYTGGNFNSTYNADRPMREILVPSDVSRVDLVAITTGHGMSDDGNCAEFCDHSHHYTVNGEEFVQNLDDPGLTSGCADKVSEGVVPNQSGTWWFGRGGWCPGARVDPFVVEVTGFVTPGEPASILYQAKREGAPPRDGSGDIRHNSWLVFYR